MSTNDTSHIRNFSIVAHIDHGKSTISDRILELTHTVQERDMESQLLDTMDIERERGITIKSNAVRVMYDADDGQTYQFNLIDTPGHVDFTYEVSRSLAACEGAVLVVDATQGVEAQTVSNANLAMNANLDIVPAINKIDLPSAHPDEVKEEDRGGPCHPGRRRRVRLWQDGRGHPRPPGGHRLPGLAPKGDADAPLKALILDSYFDEYRGVVATVRVFDGSICKGRTLLMMQSGIDFLVDGVGVKRPAEQPVDELGVGEVGYVVTGLKDPDAVRVGDTLTLAEHPTAEPLPGYREAKPMVFTGLFPVDNKDYENLRDALDKLHVNDPSLTWEPETSVALGFGFRVGFLGLLHMEVVKERLEREFNLSLIATSPSVDYHVYTTAGTMMEVRSPRTCRTSRASTTSRSPTSRPRSIVPPEYTGAVMQLAIEHRGITQDMVYLTEKSVEMHFDIPLAELTRLLRPAQEPHQGIRLPRLRVQRVPRLRAREAGHPACRRRGGRALVHRPQGQGILAGPRPVRQAEGDRSPSSSSRCPSRAPSATRSSAAPPSVPAARTSSPSATAETSRASASCSRSRRRARSA